MRFRGGGIGHQSTREATDFFRNDRDRLDAEAVTATQLLADDSDEGSVSGAEDVEDEEEDYGYIQEDLDSDVASDDQSDAEDDEYGDL